MRIEKVHVSIIFIISLTFSFSPPVSADITFTELLVDDNTHGTASLYAFDLDGDDDLDILGAVQEDHDIAWWRNDGGNPIVWTKFIIDDNFIEALSVYAKDIDGDGDLDVMGAAATSQQIAWWSNNGGDPIEWTKQVVRYGYSWAHEVFADDVDGDGDMDILGASSTLDLISLWRNEGGEPIQWTEYVIGDSFDQAKSVCTSDLDNDGDKDIIGAALLDDEVLWWRNEGGDPIEWTEFVVDDNFYGSHRVQAIDIDEDGDDDILATACLGHEIAWYRNDGGNPLQWYKQTIATNFFNACVAYGIDLDDDGDIDVVGTAQASNKVNWWRNDGGDPIVWTEFNIDDDLVMAWPLYACDLDNDGDKDVISGSSHDGINEVRWYRNERITGVFEQEQAIPRKHLQHTCYPNPFNNSTTFNIIIDTRSYVTIEIFNILGDKIDRIVDRVMPEGRHKVIWNASEKPSGVYFYRIQAGEYIETVKISLIK